MKKFLFFIILVLTAFTSLHAVDFTYEGITYTVMNEVAKTVKAKSNDPSISVLNFPSKVFNGDKEYTLVEIAYTGAWKNVTKVSIPPTVLKIENLAFRNQTIEAVIFEDATEPINLEGYPFPYRSTIDNMKSTNAYELYIGRDFIIEDKGVFNGAKSLEIGEYVTNIPAYSFCYTIPGTVAGPARATQYIGPFLSDVNIPDNIQTIEEYAFYSLYYVSDELGTDPYNSVTIGSNVTEIGKNNFYEIRDLIIRDSEKELTITSSSSINKVTRNLYMGRNWSGKNFPLVSKVEFGPLLTEIPASAFSGNTKLRDVYLPDNITTIKKQVFKDCTNLYSIFIGKGCNHIGNDVFTGCTSLRSVTSLNPIPPTITGATFNANTYQDGRLMVPSGSKSLYMTTNYWLDFYDIVELDAEQDDSGNTSGNDSPGFTDENITDYVMMEIDQEMNFSDLLPSDLTATAWVTSNDDIVDITKKGKAEAYEFGHVYISAKDIDDKVIAVFSVFVCPTVTIVHGDGVLYSHHVIYNSRPKLTLQPSNGYLISSVTHDDTVVLDELLDHQGTCTYTPEKPITANSTIYLALEENPNGGPMTGTESVISDSDVRITISGMLMEVHGAQPSEYLKIWNTNGLLLFNTRSHSVYLDEEGVYIAEIQGHKFKFAAKK